MSMGKGECSAPKLGSLRKLGSWWRWQPVPRKHQVLLQPVEKAQIRPPPGRGFPLMNRGREESRRNRGLFRERSPNRGGRSPYLPRGEGRDLRACPFCSTAQQTRAEL